jgi:hypothetical protein
MCLKKTSDPRIKQTGNVDMANYKELYSVSRQLHFEEKSRFNRMDQKASIYLFSLTILLGIIGGETKLFIETIIPPQTLLDVILLIVGCLLLSAVGISWYLIFRVLRVAELANIPLNEETFKLYSEYDDQTIYLAMSKSIRTFIDVNILITNKKGKLLRYGYIIMIISFIMLVLFCIFSAWRQWIG